MSHEATEWACWRGHDWLGWWRWRSRLFSYGRGEGKESVANVVRIARCRCAGSSCGVGIGAACKGSCGRPQFGCRCVWCWRIGQGSQRGREQQPTGKIGKNDDRRWKRDYKIESRYWLSGGEQQGKLEMMMMRFGVPILGVIPGSKPSIELDCQNCLVHVPLLLGIVKAWYQARLAKLPGPCIGWLSNWWILVHIDQYGWEAWLAKYCWVYWLAIRLVYTGPYIWTSMIEILFLC